MGLTYRKVKQHREGWALMCPLCGVVVLNQQLHDQEHEQRDTLARLLAADPGPAQARPRR